MQLAWATDIHLDFLADEQVRAFAAERSTPALRGRARRATLRGR
jgi:hypothetical protein